MIVALGNAQAKKSQFSIFTRWLLVFVIATNASSAASGSSMTDISLQNAERLLQFKVMIRATHRRCEILKEPFNQEYMFFFRSLKDKLEVSSRVVKSSFSGAHDIQSFDSLRTATANTYGLGHPQHSCRQLKAEIAEVLKHRSDTDRFIAVDRLLIGTPKHDHDTNNIASVVSYQSSPIIASSSEKVKIKSTSESDPKPLADTAAVVAKPSSPTSSTASPIKSVITQGYSGGSRSKDF